MTKIKNILLIGRTGSGKSALANVLSNSNEFTEIADVTSETKKVKFSEFELELGQKKAKYRVIDTVGIGDDQLNEEAVLYHLGEVQPLLIEGLNQIFFVVNGRISREGVEAFKLLNSVIFEQDALKYTTIIRTNFPEFEEKESCERDSRKLQEAHPEFQSVKMVHIDNPYPKGRYVGIAEECRAESRKRLITHLGSVSHLNYQSSIIFSMNKRLNSYMSEEERFKKLEKSMKEELEKKKKELEKENEKTIRKQVEERFLQVQQREREHQQEERF